MSKIDDFIAAVTEGAKGLAKDIFNGLEEQAQKDAGAFLEKTKDDIRQWTKLLAEKKLTKQELTDLIQAKKALAEIQALTQAGVALAELERFRTRLINLVIDTAFETFF